MQPVILADNSHFCSPLPLGSLVVSLSSIHDSIDSILDLDIFIETSPFYFSLFSINESFGSLIDDYFNFPSGYLSFSDFDTFHQRFSLLLSAFENIIYFPCSFPKKLEPFYLTFKCLLSEFSTVLLKY